MQEEARTPVLTIMLEKILNAFDNDIWSVIAAHRIN
jgi:hypothetical protein